MQFLGTSRVLRSAHTRRLRVEPLEDRRMLAVFSVDNLGDAGTGSLRQAIADANANIGADTVEFEAGLSSTISLTSGEMSITDDLTIDGPGAADLTIDAQQNSRIFHVTPASGPVAIEGLKLTGGKTTPFEYPNGGAILSETSALLSIESSIISGNSATGGESFGAFGGGIWANGDVMVTSSTISTNSANGVRTAWGGGVVAFHGNVAITDSSISGNSATNSGLLGAYGGGILASGDVTVIGSTISGNSVTGDLATGGGLVAIGNVTISGSMISGNSVTGQQLGVGGGIDASGDVTVTGSTISGNSIAGGVSGAAGIFAGGDLIITRSTIAENSATGDFFVGAGGVFAARDMIITDSTISGNSVVSDGFVVGGGVYANGNAVVASSTISGNSATGGTSRGAGIYAESELTITHSTISGNSATGANSSGGGVWVEDDPVTIENSIVAGNHTLDGTAPDLSPGAGPLTVRYSLIGDNTDTGLAPAPVGMPDANGNLIGTAASPIDPLLGPLQDNGGPTFTHALLPGSPAINAGDPAFVPPPDFDQRGDPFVRVFGGRIDMGAFEWQPVTLEEKIEHLLDNGVLNRGQANSLVVKLSESGNERAQLNRLRAFINEVNAMVRAGILTSAEGQKLIDGAESLRASLSVDAVLPLVVGRA